MMKIKKILMIGNCPDCGNVITIGNFSKVETPVTTDYDHILKCSTCRKAVGSVSIKVDKDITFPKPPNQFIAVKEPWMVLGNFIDHLTSLFDKTKKQEGGEQ